MCALIQSVLLLTVLLFSASMAMALEVGVEVSSFKVDHSLSHTADKLLDGDPTTAWAGGSFSSGVGQWMEFSFPLPVRIVRLGIHNGHQGEGQFEKYRRIRSGRIVYPDGVEMPFWLRDEPMEQLIECRSGPVKSFRIEVDAVFPEGVPLARMKLAVSEIKLYVTLMNHPTLEEREDQTIRMPSPPPVDRTNRVPDDIQELLKTFYVKQTSLDDDYYTLFAPHVRDRFDFQFEVFKEVQRQRGTFDSLRTAEVDPSGLGFELVYLDDDVAEVRVFGAYRVRVAHLDESLEDDSVFVLIRGTEGWKILELEGQQEDF